MQTKFQRTLLFIQNNKFNPRLLKSFDWPVLALIVLITLFGIVSIFAATASPVSESPDSVMEALNTQPTYYARLQAFWLLGGIAALAAMLYFDYELFSKYANVLYWVNIGLLVVVLFLERGRGNVAGWITWGADGMRTAQPSEPGKLAFIIALAKLFSERKKPITHVFEFAPVLIYVGLPLALIAAQPDVGTALVYIVIFGVLLFASGAGGRFLFGLAAIAVLALVIGWYWINSADAANYRADRFFVWLNPDAQLQGAGMQTYNARIAVGSGGTWGLGMFSPGSFASLNYIPDDHTDFIFAIICETFGFVGAGALALAYLVLIVRMVVLSYRAADAFGSYVIIGVMAMVLFHIVENIGMVINLLPVTGIPLPLVSYGGSNCLTNFAAIGLVLNISMRSREKRRRPPQRQTARL